MTAKRCNVRVTANFEANLEAIEQFLAEAGAPLAFDALLDDLAEHVTPTLEHHPDIGRPFLDRKAHSVEARQRIHQLTSRMGTDTISLREYIAGDFLILYAAREKFVYLLSIKHHRQLSFDFPAQWR
jgi:plasmid stabilization system protein ParE